MGMEIFVWLETREERFLLWKIGVRARYETVHGEQRRFRCGANSIEKNRRNRFSLLWSWSHGHGCCDM